MRLCVTDHCRVILRSAAGASESKTTAIDGKNLKWLLDRFVYDGA